MLNVEMLGCRRGRRLVFRGITFALDRGGLLLVKGHNGSGKSTLLRVLAGLLPVFEGEIFWRGKPVEDTAQHHTELHYLGHQDALKPQLTVNETLDYWRTLHGSRQNIKADFLEPLGMAAFGHTFIRNLSAGQKRRVALARLGIDEVPLWLLDEPSTSLDAAGQELLNNLTKQHLTKGGMAVIATHHEQGFTDAQYLTLNEVSA